MFVVHGTGIRKPIEALPNNFHLSIDTLVEEAKRIRDLGIPAILLFGIPASKDLLGTESYAQNGIVQQALRALKSKVPNLIIITDTCMSMYTPNGHSGVVENGYLVNDRSLELLAKIALVQAQAGADILAPSAMLDGQIGSMRSILDGNGFTDVPIMSYSSKYASCLYDPFFKQGPTGDSVDYETKKTHQMDICNGAEALRETALDIQEGADIVMVKPGLFYLDIVYRVKQEFQMPVAVYNVSGEYAMLTAGVQRGFIDGNTVMWEALTAFKRAGADIIITYYAIEAARQLQAGKTVLS